MASGTRSGTGGARAGQLAAVVTLAYTRHVNIESGTITKTLAHGLKRQNKHIQHTHRIYTTMRIVMLRLSILDFHSSACFLDS